MNRRKFLYAVAGGSAAIAGWVLVPGCLRPQASRQETGNRYCPVLANRVEFLRTTGGGELMKPDDRGTMQVVCRSNEHGATIIESLNGKNSLQDLAKKLHAGFDPEHLEHTEASVVSFLAMLAQAGVLSEPFFANIYACEITA